MHHRLGREAEKVVRGKAVHRAGTKEKEGRAQQPRRTDAHPWGVKVRRHSCRSKQRDPHGIAGAEQLEASTLAAQCLGGRTAGSIPHRSSVGLQGRGMCVLGPLGRVQGEQAVAARITGPGRRGCPLWSPDLTLPSQPACPCPSCTLHHTSFSKRCLREALPHREPFLSPSSFLLERKSPAIHRRFQAHWVTTLGQKVSFFGFESLTHGKKHILLHNPIYVQSKSFTQKYVLYHVQRTLLFSHPIFHAALYGL